MAVLKRQRHANTLYKKYPPSEPCSCEVCRSYCNRPGWWTVEEAARAVEAGHGPRMMLEMAPGNAYGVLSAAFKGNEGDFSREIFSEQGCTFLNDGLCELFGTGLQPLECRYCHHDRVGFGSKCHADIEKDWNTPAGRELVVHWTTITHFWIKKQRLS